MTRFIAPILIGSLMLAGCGGGGGGGGGTVTEDLFDPSAVGNVGDVENATPTSIEDLPVSGEFTYGGQLALQVTENDIAGETIVGDTVLAVTFASNGGEFFGAATNFVGVDTNGAETDAYTGTLDITDGTIVQGGTAFIVVVDQAIGDRFPVTTDEPATEDMVGLVADVSGTLTSITNVETTFDGDLIAAFSDGDTDAGVVGLTLGTTVSDSGPGEFTGFIAAINLE